MEWGVAATNAAWATSSYRYRFSESRDRNLTNLTGPTRHGQQTKSPSIEHALGIGGVLHVNAVNVIQHVRYFVLLTQTTIGGGSLDAEPRQTNKRDLLYDACHVCQ